MKYILLIAILSFTSLSYSVETCNQLLSTESASRARTQEPVLTRHGDTYWGFYQCNSCDNRVSAQPNVHGDQACHSCGAGHTNEKYIPPALFRKGGGLYLVDPGRLIREESEQALADSGETTGCPFCGNSQFSIDEACISCGAQAESPRETRDLMRQASQSSRMNSTVIPNQSSVTPRIDFSSTSRGRSGPRVTRRGLGLAAGVILAVTSGYGIIWGNQTYMIEGVVTDFNSSEVTVEYSDKDGDLEMITLGRPGNETQIWREGEILDLYFINWSSTPRGAERLDGNVLAPAE